MKISLGLTTSMPVRSSIKYAKLAEKNGYHRIWVGEDILSREIFSYLSVICLNTEDIKIGCGVTSPYVRTIPIIASGFAGIQELSCNRFTLGIGVGGIPEIKKMTGKTPTQVADVIWETVFLLNKIFKGEKVSYDGVKACVTDFKLNLSKDFVPPKIYLGVRGPRLMALAGEIADGVIFSGAKDYLKHSLRILDSSAKESRRNPKDITRVLWNGFLIEKDREDRTGRRDRRIAKTMVATIVSSLPGHAIDYLDKDSKDRELILKIKKEFLKDHKKASAIVTDDLIDQFCISGSVDEITDAIREYGKLGFDEFVIGPPYGRDPGKVIESFGGRGDYTTGGS